MSSGVRASITDMIALASQHAVLRYDTSCGYMSVLQPSSGKEGAYSLGTTSWVMSCVEHCGGGGREVLPYTPKTMNGSVFKIHVK